MLYALKEMINQTNIIINYKIFNNNYLIGKHYSSTMENLANVIDRDHLDL